MKRFNDLSRFYLDQAGRPVIYTDKVQLLRCLKLLNHSIQDLASSWDGPDDSSTVNPSPLLLWQDLLPVAEVMLTEEKLFRIKGKKPLFSYSVSLTHFQLLESSYCLPSQK